jgi:hypothetical protein
MTRNPKGFEQQEATMSRWRKFAVTALDCAAIVAGALIALPFLLILAAPFYMGG